MATIIESFLVKLESRADTTGFQAFEFLSNRLVVTLGDLIGLAERGAKALGDFFKPALEADQIRAKIQGFGGDVNKVWKDLMDMSLQMGTPFQEALDGFTKLKAYGIDKASDALRTLKTITSATGGDLKRTIIAYGQMNAMGSLQGQEKNQFINAGVDIWGALQRYTGKKLGELQAMMRNRELTSDIVTNALIKEAARLKPIADKMAKTLKAQLTNIETLFYNFRAKMSQTRIWAGVTDGLIKLVQYLTNLGSDDNMTKFFDNLDKAVFNFIDNMKHLYDEVTNNFPAMVAICAAAIYTIGIPAIAAFSRAIVALTLRMLANPVVILAAALGTLLAVLIDLDDATRGKQTLVPWSKDAIAVYETIKGFILWMVHAFEDMGDKDFWTKMKEGAKAAIDEIGTWLGGMLAAIEPQWVKDILGWMQHFFGEQPAYDASKTPNAKGYEDAYNASQRPNLPAGIPQFNPPKGGGGGGSGFMDWMRRAAETQFDKNGNYIAAGEGAKTASQTSGRSMYPQTVIQHQDNSVKVDATITGVDNPQATGEAVSNEVKAGQKANANLQANSGTGGVKQ